MLTSSLTGVALLVRLQTKSAKKCGSTSIAVRTYNCSFDTSVDLLVKAYDTRKKMANCTTQPPL